MCSSAPTCVLSGPPSSCIQSVATISSEVERSSAPFFCDRGIRLEEQTVEQPAGNPSRCCPMTGILPAITRSHDIEEEPPQSAPQVSSSSSVPLPSGKVSKPNKCGWKTSKFFSRTMSSGEILRGLKKLSLTSSGSSSDTGEVENGGRPRKSKSGQLKKRSSYGDNEGSVDDDPKVRSPRSPGGFRPLSKAMSLSEPGSSKTSNLGIVCRKEDLKAILCTASKKFPLASPSKRRRGQAALRQTKSASFDTPEGDKTFRKEPVRRAGSEEYRTRRNNQSVEDHEAQKPDFKCPDKPENPSPIAAVVERLNAQNSSVSSEGDKPQAPQNSGEGSLSTVKWDESEVVDAVIIGDAIESFLKGSMSGSEKKVSFRKSSDRKTKSDG